MNTPDYIPIREPAQIRQDCARNLRAVEVSDHFQAILGCLLGEGWTTPRLAEMAIMPYAKFHDQCVDESGIGTLLMLTGTN